MWTFVLTVVTVFSAVLCQDLFSNLTKEHSLYRQKRSLIFDGGGVNKMIFTFVFPVVTEDPIAWRAMLGLFNLHTQYNVPTRSLYPWDLWENYDRRSLESVKEEFEKTGTFTVDESRIFLYEFLRKYMERQGSNGEACLHRAFCENAQIDHHDGLYSEIVGRILTPGRIDDEFQDSYNAGKAGVNCEKLFKECPKGDSLFDEIFVDVS
ncbi:hypothetical protein ACFFRR_003826 [Megaselia abdita]